MQLKLCQKFVIGLTFSCFMRVRRQRKDPSLPQKDFLVCIVPSKDSNNSGMCQASADFAVFCNFWLSQKGGPFEVQSHFFGVGNIFCLQSQSKILNFSRCSSLTFIHLLMRSSTFWQQNEVSCSISLLCLLLLKSNPKLG